MKIAYVVSLFPKLSETFILRELIEIRRRGHEVVILSLKKDLEAIVHEEARELIPSTIYPVLGWELAASVGHHLLRRPLALLGATWRVAAAHARRPGVMVKSLALIPMALLFARKLRAAGAQHVHAHWASYPATVAWIISRMTGLPYSVTGHAHDLFLPNPMLARKVRDAAFFATISEFNRSLLIQTCGRGALGKIRLIRCGVPVEELRFAPRPLDGAGGRAPLVASVGRLVEYKGFDVLIRACARLRDRGRPVRCVIVGEGPERGRLSRLVEDLGLRDQVTLAGWRRQDDVQDLIASSDLFVLACVRGRDGQQDGVPIVLMEAMALGVPVVSTRLSGIPELVVDNRTGLLAAPGDERHLADAMERMLEDRALAGRVREAAREIVEKEFNLDRSVTQLCREFARSGART